jgi:hypothetical protein
MGEFKMKTAIYIEDGIVQLVLTPSNQFERDAVKSFGNENLSIKNFIGSFYECKGGWVRQINDDKSIIIRIDKNKEEQGFVKEIENTNFPNHLKIASASKAEEITATGNYPIYLFVKDLTNNEKINIRYKIDM